MRKTRRIIESFPVRSTRACIPRGTPYNASGQASSWVITRLAGATISCTVTQGNPGAPSPLAVGQAWTVNYAETCGSGAGTAFIQSGTLAGVEPITAAAGTFSAFKFTFTFTRTVNGMTRTETVTRWRDASGTDSRVLKATSVFTYSGAGATLLNAWIRNQFYVD